ncbi:unnamed protein product [Cylindrotheca closterium]|uniref:Zinc transporter n=1 Tax=Cylindrotheca closterium TaxID=2856 RepID=A0AAD2FN37_9STRA|nr:unnamed protein product [Cylindrotheca closterium]
MEADNRDNVLIALAMVFGAGASTGLGAAVVFFPSIVKLASQRVLAASLGFSAGVMTYVSFVEIFIKSYVGFEDAGYERSQAYVYSTFCFFGGVVLMILLNVVVAKLLGEDSHHHAGPVNPVSQQQHQRENNRTTQLPSSEAKESEDQQDGGSAKGSDDDFVENLPLSNGNAPVVVGDVGGDSISDDESPKDKEEQRKLIKMGMNTALAIALHNFPEGLATFVAAVDDPSVGTVLACAIAIHNIPEGLCVALPIYYATGSRSKAFLWALLSGASEIVAALLGWAILAAVVDDATYAALFGIVAGMMVIISIRELLPTAHHYDPEDTVVTYSFIAGMLLMAISLVLFML